MTTLTLEELCAEVNRRLSDGNVQPSSGRTNPVVTPRNVRYYQTLGLLPPVTRQGGRAVYGPEHVEAVVRIKEAQADGVELRNLQAETAETDAAQAETALLDSVEPLARLFSRSAVVAHPAPVFRRALESPAPPVLFSALMGPAEGPTVERGWSVDLSSAVRLTGTGAPPSADVLERIQELLDTDRYDDEDDDEPF